MAKSVLASNFQTRLRVAGLIGALNCAKRQGHITQGQASSAIVITLDKRGISRKYLSDPRIRKVSNIVSNELIRLQVNCSDPYAPQRALNSFPSKVLKRIENLLD